MLNEELFDGVDIYQQSVCKISETKRRELKLKANPLVLLGEGDKVIWFDGKTKNDEASRFLIISTQDRLWLKGLCRTLINLFDDKVLPELNAVLTAKSTAKTVKYAPQSWIRFLRGYLVKLRNERQEMTHKQAVRIVDLIDTLRTNVPSLHSLHKIKFVEKGQ